MTKMINTEATERLETVRRIITNLHFANRLTEEEKAHKKELEKEYNEITTKYEIKTVYIAKAYDTKAGKWIVLGEAKDTREEARELFATTEHYHKDITDKEVCYNK